MRLGTGGFSFGPHALDGENPFEVEFGDFNGDGKLDLVAGGADMTASLMVGSGDGSFTADPPFYAPTELGSLSLADIDADGRVDLLFAYDSHAHIASGRCN